MSGPGGAAGEPAVAGGERQHAAGGERIAAAFAGHGRSAALMPYLMGGFPDLEGSRRAGHACADAGADVIELGIPFSDPLADGPVIHAAGSEALKAGVTPADVLGVCESLAERVPVVLMVYANVIESAGAEAFVARAAGCGAAGVIVPDLPHDEAGDLRSACDAGGLALVPLAAPTTTTERLEEIAADARGFVYTVALTGITGEREQLQPDLSDTVARVRAASRLPVAVGFGVSTPEHARLVGELADGVIVGTRIVRAAGEQGPEGVGELVGRFAAALA